MTMVIHVWVGIHFFFENLIHLNSEGLVGLISISLLIIFWSYVYVQQTKEVIVNLKYEVARIGADNTDLNLQLKNLKKYKSYTLASDNISMAFSEIHDLHRFIEASNPQIENINDRLGRMSEFLFHFCDHVLYAFERMVNTSEMSVCIKIISENEIGTKETSTVVTLIRDKKNYNQRHKDSNKKHAINLNTAYLKVFRNVNSTERCFFCNNLPLFRGYQNTSFSIYGQKEYAENMSDSDRVENWKLPYRSTIVSGIYPESPHLKDAKNILGYICVDSSEIDTFDEVLHVKLLNSLSDGMYNVISEFKRFTFQANKFKKNEKRH